MCPTSPLSLSRHFPPPTPNMLWVPEALASLLFHSFLLLCEGNPTHIRGFPLSLLLGNHQADPSGAASTSCCPPPDVRGNPTLNVLASHCCCNRLPPASCLKTTNGLSYRRLARLHKAKIKASAGLCACMEALGGGQEGTHFLAFSTF